MSGGTLESLSYSGELVIDPEAQRIAEFLDVIGEISIIKEIDQDIDFTQKRPVEDAQMRFMLTHYKETPSLFLNADVLPLADSDAAFIEFEPVVTRGGKRSAHGVFFGYMCVSGNELAVAVKPHARNGFETGLNDYFNLQAISEQGFNTLQPAGLILSDRETDRAYSLTVLEEGLTTFDSIDWQSFYPALAENPGMQELWRQVSDLTAILHADGNKRHGDLAARNIASLPEGGAYFIDWEHAILSDEQQHDTQARFDHSYADLKTLAESMCKPASHAVGGVKGIGIFYGKDGDWWEGFKEIFFDEYVEARTQLAKEGSHRGQVEKDVEKEIFALEQTLKNDIKGYQAACSVE